MWKNILGFEGIYQVSNFGNVKSLARDKVCNKKNIVSKEILLKPANEQGYSRVRLQKGSFSKMYRVHRLVAISFIENPLNKKEVNHINAIKSDNKVENLEWCSNLENVRHARANGLYPKMIISDNHKKILKESNSKKVIDTVTGKLYNSATLAALDNNIRRSTLIHYLIGTRKNKTNLAYLTKSKKK